MYSLYFSWLKDIDMQLKANTETCTSLLVSPRPRSVCRPTVKMKNVGTRKICHLSSRFYHVSRIVTKPTKWYVYPAKTQISLGIHPVWSESSLSAWRKLGSLATHWTYSKDSDQTGQMPRLIWVFAGRTVILLVLSWGGSCIVKYTHKMKMEWQTLCILIRLLLHELLDLGLHCLQRPICSEYLELLR